MADSDIFVSLHLVIPFISMACVGLVEHQGYQIGQFLPIGLLLEAHYDFLKRQSSPK
jgi:hypothetical protein